jgi:hypothetical protein
MHPIYLVVGCPGSGKTWVCEQLADRFLWAPHDEHDERDYPRILLEGKHETMPVLGEIPFGLSKIQEEIEATGRRVIPVFIIEPDRVLRARYLAREGKPIPKGHLTRQETYRLRALAFKSFQGTAIEVLAHLKSIPL